jgi:hypothetical protein
MCMHAHVGVVQVVDGWSWEGVPAQLTTGSKSSGRSAENWRLVRNDGKYTSVPRAALINLLEASIGLHPCSPHRWDEYGVFGNRICFRICHLYHQ